MYKHEGQATQEALSKAPPALTCQNMYLSWVDRKNQEFGLILIGRWRLPISHKYQNDESMIH